MTLRQLSAVGRTGVLVGRFDSLAAYGLKRLLAEDRRIDVVADNLPDDVLGEVLTERDADVLVVDGGTKFGVLAELRKLAPEMGLVVVVRRPSRNYGYSLLTSGITCVAGSASLEAIMDAVHLAGSGTPVFISQMGERFERRDWRATESLTRGEVTVLARLSRDGSYAQAARDLCLSVETVRSHSKSIRRKLGVSHRDELVGILQSVP